MSQYIKSVSFTIVGKKISEDELKKILSKKKYTIEMPVDTKAKKKGE